MVALDKTEGLKSLQNLCYTVARKGISKLKRLFSVLPVCLIVRVCAGEIESLFLISYLLSCHPLHRVLFLFFKGSGAMTSINTPAHSHPPVLFFKKLGFFWEGGVFLIINLQLLENRGEFQEMLLETATAMCPKNTHLPPDTLRKAQFQCTFKSKIGVGVGDSFIFNYLATGIVPKQLEYTTVSSGEEGLLLVATAGMKPGIEKP